MAQSPWAFVPVVGDWFYVARQTAADPVSITRVVALAAVHVRNGADAFDRIRPVLDTGSTPDMGDGEYHLARIVAGSDLDEDGVEWASLYRRSALISSDRDEPPAVF